MKVSIEPKIEKSMFAQRVYMALLNTAETAVAKIGSVQLSRIGPTLRVSFSFTGNFGYITLAISDFSTLLGRAGIFVQRTEEKSENVVVDLTFPSTEFSDIDTPRSRNIETKTVRKQLLLPPSVHEKGKSAAKEIGISFNDFVCQLIAHY